MIKLITFLALTLMLSVGTLANENKPTTNLEKSTVIIDVRTAQEFSAGNIKNSKLIPYDVITQKIAQVVPSKDTPIVLYCRSGRRSGIAERYLKDMGYTNVENYGGMEEAKRKLGIK